MADDNRSNIKEVIRQIFGDIESEDSMNTNASAREREYEGIRDEKGFERDVERFESDEDGIERDVEGSENDEDGLERGVEGFERDKDGVARDVEGSENDEDGFERGVEGSKRDVEGVDSDDDVVEQTIYVENANDSSSNADIGPQLGMVFPSFDKLFELYQEHARLKGFSVVKRCGHKGNDGIIKYQTISCDKRSKILC